jgi:hypothetical protein
MFKKRDEKQAAEETRRAIFTGLFEQTLKGRQRHGGKNHQEQQ